MIRIPSNAADQVNIKTKHDNLPKSETLIQIPVPIADSAATTGLNTGKIDSLVRSESTGSRIKVSLNGR